MRTESDASARFYIFSLPYVFFRPCGRLFYSSKKHINIDEYENTRRRRSCEAHSGGDSRKTTGKGETMVEKFNEVLIAGNIVRKEYDSKERILNLTIATFVPRMDHARGEAPETDGFFPIVTFTDDEAEMLNRKINMGREAGGRAKNYVVVRGRCESGTRLVYAGRGLFQQSREPIVFGESILFSRRMVNLNSVVLGGTVTDVRKSVRQAQNGRPAGVLYTFGVNTGNGTVRVMYYGTEKDGVERGEKVGIMGVLRSREIQREEDRLVMSVRQIVVRTLSKEEPEQEPEQERPRRQPEAQPAPVQEKADPAEGEKDASDSWD